MDCYRHPGTPSVATCISCAQPVCEECREVVAGHPMCKACVADASARLSTSSSESAGAALTSVPASTVTVNPTASTAGVIPEVAMDVAQGQWGAPPGLARRVLRGLGWGVIYGQWWTVLTVAWDLFFGATRGDFSFDVRTILAVVIFAIVYGLAGGLTGLIIGASNAPMSAGASVGIGAGLLLCLLETLAMHNFGGLLNVFFYFFTGRFVGAGITWRVHQPVK